MRIANDYGNSPQRLEDLSNGDSNLAAQEEVRAEMGLERLDRYDKEICLQILEQSNFADLYDAILNFSAETIFPHDCKLFARQHFWQTAKQILDFGSGNGSYLNHLAMAFDDKSYLGIEKSPSFVEQAGKKFASVKLKFREGNVEATSDDLIGQYDVITCRMALEYLNNPRLALENASWYLREGGHVVIIDAYDPAMKGSHIFPIIKETVRLQNEKNKAEEKGNRQITIEILRELKKQSGRLSELYEVVYTNLDEEGRVLEEIVKFEGAEAGKQQFTFSLLYLACMAKGLKIPIDFSQAYDDLHVLLDDNHVWASPGMHYLILKKKPIN